MESMPDTPWVAKHLRLGRSWAYRKIDSNKMTPNQCLNQPSSEKFPTHTETHSWTVWRGREILEYPVLNGMSLSHSSPRIQLTVWKKKQELVGVREEGWHQRNILLQTPQAWHTCELTETEAACAGPAHIQTRWGPSVEGESLSSPIPSQEVMPN